jgi:hypothetical protein
MTASERPDAGGAVYQFTIVGTLGPVLRRALEPYVTASQQRQTVVRADAPERGDLVDLVRLLESRGLEIASICVLT